MEPASVHVRRVGILATVRPYLPDLVYGANDGISTTFAVVAGVAGGALSQKVVLVIGVANLLADGLSMAAGNYQAIRSREGVLRTQTLPEEKASPSFTPSRRSWRSSSPARSPWSGSCARS